MSLSPTLHWLKLICWMLPVMVMVGLHKTWPPQMQRNVQVLHQLVRMGGNIRLKGQREHLKIKSQMPYLNILAVPQKSLPFTMHFMAGPWYWSDKDQRQKWHFFCLDKINKGYIHWTSHSQLYSNLKFYALNLKFDIWNLVFEISKVTPWFWSNCWVAQEELIILKFWCLKFCILSLRYIESDDWNLMFEIWHLKFYICNLTLR